MRISTLATQIYPKSRFKSRCGLGLARDSTSSSWPVQRHAGGERGGDEQHAVHEACQAGPSFTPETGHSALRFTTPTRGPNAAHCACALQKQIDSIPMNENKPKCSPIHFHPTP